MSDKPNFYAILPAFVRYDTELSANAKLLYSEITSLCNEKGFCWATNSYFANLYGISERTIQNLIKQINDKDYITIKILGNSKRLIYIDYTRYEKNFVGGVKKISYPHEKNFTHNNKINNKININNNNNESIENFNDFDIDWLNDSDNLI